MITKYRTPKAVLFSVPIPAETRTYKPVSHMQLAETTLEGIHKAGFKVNKQEYSSANYGLIANARYTISDVKDSEMQLEIGWQNSYNKTLSLKFAIGARIFICSNGCVSGDMGAFKKAHRGNIKDFTPDAIIEAVKTSGDTFAKIQRQRDVMKEVEVSNKEKAEILGRMFIEHDIITSTQLGIVKEQIKKPTFDYACEDSLWELYNYITYALKDSHPFNWIRNHNQVHDFFTKTTDIVKRPAIIDAVGKIISSKHADIEV